MSMKAVFYLHPEKNNPSKPKWSSTYKTVYWLLTSSKVVGRVWMILWGYVIGVYYEYFSLNHPPRNAYRLQRGRYAETSWVFEAATKYKVDELLVHSPPLPPPQEAKPVERSVGSLFRSSAELRCDTASRLDRVVKKHVIGQRKQKITF